MKKFPKVLYVTRAEDFSEYFVEEKISKVIEHEEDGTEIAVYELVKMGSVVEKIITRKSKVGFE